VGWGDRYRYPSHGLRFEVNSPTETQEQFLSRINMIIRRESGGHPGTSSPRDYWKIGQNRDKGSIHSDTWRGTARELADSNLIGIFPVIGWWFKRGHLKKYNSQTRYSLIVSIRTPEVKPDIFIPVATEIGLTTPILINVQ